MQATEPDTPNRRHGGWSTRKKDKAPRGVRRYSAGAWGIRYACGAGHFHKESIGPVKGDAISAYHKRRLRVQTEPGWCPQIEAAQQRALAEAARAKEAARVTFRDFAADYLQWAKTHKRSWKTNAGQIKAATAVFGDTRSSTRLPQATLNAFATRCWPRSRNLPVIGTGTC